MRVRRRSSGRRCRTRGFTLLELTIASGILLLVLAVATESLIAAGRLFALAPRNLRGGEPELAERQLRGDLAAGMLVAGSGFPDEALTLERDGIRIVWELEGEQLRRRVEDPAAATAEGRLMLDGVLAFRWFELSARAVEVQIVRRTARPLSAAHLATPGWSRAGAQMEALVVTVAARRDR